MIVIIRSVFSIVIISFLPGAFSVVTAEDTNNDYDAIKITIENYFEGFKHGDRVRLEKAFALPYAHMKGYIKDANGQLVEVSRPMGEVIDDWVSRQPSPNFQGRILSINIFSEVAAQATFDFNGIFTDAFQLAKINGEWRIVNKFYVNQ